MSVPQHDPDERDNLAGGSACEMVPIVLSDSERIEYQKIAERCGLSLAEWIAEQLRLAAKREAKEA
jgi:hypothetical protein